MNLVNVLSGFEELRRRWLTTAKLIVSEYSGQPPAVRHLGLQQLDDIGLEIAEKIEAVNKGTWPQEILKILGSAMRELIGEANKLKNSRQQDLPANTSFLGSTGRIWN